MDLTHPQPLPDARRTVAKGGLRIAVACCLFFSLTSATLGDDAAGPQSDLHTIDLADLPSPPAEIAELIERGNVRFVYGPRPESMQSKLLPGGSAAALRKGRRLAATTEYRMGYHYRSRNRWKFVNQNREADLREVRIGMRFSDVRLETEHTVWFRKRPESETFWTDRLVLHELDHVRISVDPLLEKRFRDLLRSNASITLSMERGETVAESRIHPAVDSHVTELFSRISDLVDIRYQELDRLTDHGLKAFPEGSSLESIKKFSSKP
ncbi:hypothetical protein RMSM_01696 [Rhodopirellula maiorica SM1]|uniref:Uncharacterized protein n=1 Tax=Rhodopirellula maiorica SM1 TaxID=1265738 RepID=M5RPV0_9BACT|nr:hypothetical protein [Rhodopirellula maiorica]EMI21358.1 hypothetical protein RMSM_01696 [Rhodopirellula maiorica SM1]